MCFPTGVPFFLFLLEARTALQLKFVMPNVKVNRPATAGCGRRTICVRLERPAVAGPVERPVRRSPSEGRELESSRHCGTRASMRTKKAAAYWDADGKL